MGVIMMMMMLMLTDDNMMDQTLVAKITVAMGL